MATVNAPTPKNVATTTPPLHDNQETVTQEQPNCISKAFTWISETFKSIGENIMHGIRWSVSLITCGKFCNEEESSEPSKATESANKANAVVNKAESANKNVDVSKETK